MPKTIALIVKYIGGYGFAKSTELMEVVEDGVPRKPKTDDINIAMIWLMDRGYQAQSFTWLDRPGLLSRNRCQVYALPSN